MVEITYEYDGKQLIFLRHCSGLTFAIIDSNPIGKEEAKRMANLFTCSPSMLALLEKALPIIEAEAHARCDAMRRNGLTPDDSTWWVEVVELKNEIRAEIDKAYGK